MEEKDSTTIRHAVINKAIGFIFDHIEEEITVEKLDSFLVVYERKKGNYHDLPEQWCKFIKKYEHLSSADTIYMESTIDDPSITDEAGGFQKRVIAG